MNPSSPWKETQLALSRVRVSLGLAAKAILRDLGRWKKETPSQQQPTAPSSPRAASKPRIFVSYATDENLKGSHQFCGGEKLLNNLVLLLRRKGFEAWMVSLDGKHSGWLAEHAPFLSLAEFQEKLAASTDHRCVTSWLPARAFLQHCPKFYFWDQELGASSRSHFPLLAEMISKNRILRIAGVNRSVQTFHRAVFEQEALLLQQLIDEHYWQPDETSRVSNRVGFFDEGEHGCAYVDTMQKITRAAGLDLDFHQIRGNEPEVIRQMQSCAVFVALNLGKSILYGEGGPMSPQEAMACGTVPVCFDIQGPWEVIQKNYNGKILADFSGEAAGMALLEIFSEPGRREEMSRRCVEMTRSSHTMEARWPDVARFLKLA